MAASNKDTIYIDIDDEITGIIDKLKASNGKVVALVLPKRASVFQSIVNMKLLKRAADSSKKHLVLITSEAGLLPLAGAAGVHVAKTLTSKPEVPVAPDNIDDSEETVSEDFSDMPTDANPPTGDEVETLVLEDEDIPPEADAPSGPKTFAPPVKKNKKLAIPNFEKFRLLLVGGVVLFILLIVGLIYALTAMPKAVISIKTDATAVDVNLNLNLSTDAKTLNIAEKIVPARLAQQQKTFTQQVPTTGQKNNGNKASGSVAIINCTDPERDVVIPAGTGLSSGGNTYITQESVTVSPSSFSSPGTGSKCLKNGKENVDVLAQSGGTAYNIPSGAAFSVAGQGSQVTGTGGTISGGTDNIVQTVNQNDINNAKAKINTTDENIKKALKTQLEQAKYRAIDATYTATTPTVTPSANVGEVATSVTVTGTVTYTMFGVHKADLETLINQEVKSQIDTEKQSVLDNGLNKAVFNVDNLTEKSAALSMSTTATAGPDLDIDSIKRMAAGKKPGPLREQLENNPDVTSVEVKLSPFWVSAVPKKTEKIIVNIAKPTSNKASSSNGDNP